MLRLLQFFFIVHFVVCQTAVKRYYIRKDLISGIKAGEFSIYDPKVLEFMKALLFHIKNCKELFKPQTICKVLQHLDFLNSKSKIEVKHVLDHHENFTGDSDEKSVIESILSIFSQK